MSVDSHNSSGTTFLALSQADLLCFGGSGIYSLRERPGMTASCQRELLQLCILRLGFLQDGDVGVGVGVFPEREEIFVDGERTDAGGVGIRSLRGSRLQGIGTSNAQMR